VYVIYFFAFVVLWRLFSKSVLYFPRYWVYSALMKGEYTQALRNVQQLETKYSQDFAALYNRGTILLFAGQYSEAEKFLRQSLQVGQKMTSFLPEILTNLGYTFLRQGRYEEATRAFEGAIKLNPKAGHACCGLTEVYLFQGKEPQRALDLLVHFMNTTPKREVRDKTVWSSIISDEAWALALLGRHSINRGSPGWRVGVSKKGKFFNSRGIVHKPHNRFTVPFSLIRLGLTGNYLDKR